MVTDSEEKIIIIPLSSLRSPPQKKKQMYDLGGLNIKIVSPLDLSHKKGSNWLAGCDRQSRGLRPFTQATCVIRYDPGYDYGANGRAGPSTSGAGVGNRRNLSRGGGAGGSGGGGDGDGDGDGDGVQRPFCHPFRVVSVVPRLFPLRLGKGTFASQGKAANQQHALRAIYG